MTNNEIIRKFFSKYEDNTFLKLFKSQNKPPENIMEIGVFNGCGAERMIRMAKYSGAKNIRYFGFDLFGEVPDNEPNAKSEVACAEKAREVFDRYGVFGMLLGGDTKIVLPKAIKDLPMMDFIYIDGGHSYETCKSDWENVKHLTHNDTIVLFDDYNTEGTGVRKVVDEISQEDYKIKIFKVDLIKQRAAVKRLLK